MRDFDRIREREGGRSPSAIGVFLLVAFGAVFAGGIWVGQRRAESHAPSIEDPLAALDGSEPAAAEPLVFHEALRLPSPPSNDVNAAIAPVSPSVVASRVVAPSIRVVAPGVEAAPPIDPVGRDDAPALRPPVAPEVAPVPVGADGIFTLHVASYETEAEAEQFSTRMRSAGHRAFVVRTAVEGRGMLYRVRVGPFHTLAEAQRYRLDFEAQMSLPTFIVRRELPEAPAAPARRPTT